MDSDNLDDVIGEAAAELTAAATPEPTPAAEAPAPVVEAAAEATPAEESAEAKAERARDLKTGQFTKAQKEAADKAAKAAAKPVEPQKATKPAEAQAAPVEAQKPAEAALKAPQSWKPAARDKWANLPPEVQAEAIRIDREVKQVLEQSAPARKFQENFERTLTPYMPMLRAGGADPLNAIQNMAQTFHTLQSGTTEQKARLIFEAMRANRIPVEAINTYLQDPDAAPPQQAAAPVQQQDDVEARVMQRIHAQQAQTFWADFATKHEFFQDVRADMGLLMKAAAESGRQMTPEDAYNRALALNDSVQEALAQRKQAAAATQQSQAATQARAAAVSVRSQPAGVTPPRKLESIEDYVAAAAEEMNTR